MESRKQNRAVGSAVLCLIGALLGAGGREAAAADERDFLEAYCKPNTSTVVPSGSEAEARQYYRDLAGRIGLEIQDPTPDKPGPATTVSDVAVYLGYGPLNAATPLSTQELQDLAPADLMDPGRLGPRLGGLSIPAGDVLVARFFAPKISDVSGAKVTSAGWRKLVRMRAQPNSPARRHGIGYGVILFNFFAPLEVLDPFNGNESVNTQVILVDVTKKRELVWLDFGRTREGGSLTHALNAFFDAGHIPSSATAENGGAAAYFVPCGCISCHGGLGLDLAQRPPAPTTHFATAVLNYLDTDHWQGRIATGDDFEGLQAPVLFDPGTFGVLLQLNQEIARQNAAAQPMSMLRRAAEHWLTWHLIRGAETEPLFERSLHNPDGPAIWDPKNPVDAELLPKLNRYCFRCHGSVAFDVLDKGMVLAQKSKIHAALFPRDEIEDPRAAMPPDRTLSVEELNRLRDLVLKLQ